MNELTIQTLNDPPRRVLVTKETRKLVIRYTGVDLLKPAALGKQYSLQQLHIYKLSTIKSYGVEVFLLPFRNIMILDAPGFRGNVQDTANSIISSGQGKCLFLTNILGIIQINSKNWHNPNEWDKLPGELNADRWVTSPAVCELLHLKSGRKPIEDDE